MTNLKGTDILVACVVGFHEGTQDTLSKLSEARSAVSAGASELDVVINWPLLKKRRYSEIYNELASIRSLCRSPTVLKLILETSQLSRRDIVAAAYLAHAARFDFIKTSTGFNGRGASVEDVRLMSAAAIYCANHDSQTRVPMKVKASGGVRGMEDAKRMLEAGASRIGTSSGVWIMQEARKVKEGSQSGDAAAPGQKLSRMYTDESVEGY
jgi:deoxyribose-phosphate aldolase